MEESRLEARETLSQIRMNLGMVVHTLIPAPRRQKQVDLNEFKTRLLHGQFQISQYYKVKPFLKSKTTNKHPKTIV